MEKESHMIWKIKKKGKKCIFLLHLNEFNLNDGFKNYIVPNIFYAPSMKKNVWKKKNIYIYIHTHNPICYIYSFCCTIPKLTKKIKNKKLLDHWNFLWMQKPTKNS